MCMCISVHTGMSACVLCGHACVCVHVSYAVCIMYMCIVHVCIHVHVCVMSACVYVRSVCMCVHACELHWPLFSLEAFLFLSNFIPSPPSHTFFI